MLSFNLIIIIISQKGFKYYVSIAGGGLSQNDSIAGACRRRGEHTGLLCDTLPRRGLFQCLMLDYACRGRLSTLIMVPINFGQNSNPFKKQKQKKTIFLA